MNMRVTLLNLEGQISQFTVINTELETNLAVLNALIRRGNRLLEANMGKSTNWVQLPVEALDGQDCTHVMNQLIEESRQLVANPFSKTFSYEWNTIDSLSYHKLCVSRIELIINYYEKQIQVANPVERQSEFVEKALERCRRALFMELAGVQRLPDL